jgi:hypothetical protein
MDPIYTGVQQFDAAADTAALCAARTNRRAQAWKNRVGAVGFGIAGNHRREADRLDEDTSLFRNSPRPESLES